MERPAFRYPKNGAFASLRLAATSSEKGTSGALGLLLGGAGGRDGGVTVHFKICGVTNLEDADAALEVGASSIGVNLVPGSSRMVDLETARKIAGHVGRNALIVLVVVDLGVDEMRELLRVTGARCLQLHGDESVDVVGRLMPHAYKAVRVGSQVDVEHVAEYPGEHLLVDAQVKDKLGGTGRVLDWSLVELLARRRKLTVAGGLTASNVVDAIA